MQVEVRLCLWERLNVIECFRVHESIDGLENRAGGIRVREVGVVGLRSEDANVIVRCGC